MKNLNWVVSQLRFFGKSLLKLTRNSKSEIEVIIGWKAYIIDIFDPI